MKLFAGCLAAGLVLFAAGAQAQMLAPYRAASDFGGPYASAVPEAPPGPRYGYGPAYGPALLPPTEVYAVLRDNGFSPLGIPRQRGFAYVIDVIDHNGETGRLVIDARDGRIIRFRPAYRIGERFSEEPAVIYGQPGSLPPSTQIRGEPRPPRSIPHVASRTVPVPKASPLVAKPEAAKPEVAKAEPSKDEISKPETRPEQQQSAATQSKPAEAPATPPAVTTGSAPPKPVAQIAPTQDLPKAQGLE